MPAPKKQEATIIEIIQKMVKEGESEKKIIQTLTDLGVDEKKARKLLLVGEADTLALLRNELVKIVQERIEAEKPGLEETIKEEIKSTADQTRKEILQKTVYDLQEYESDIKGELQVFKEQEQEKLSQINFFSDRVKEKISHLSAQLQTVQLDMDEMKVKGISSQNRNISRILIGMGILFGLVDLYFLLSGFGSGLSIDAIILMAIVALISVTMFFVATVI